MHLLPNKKAVPSWTRRDELRKARAAAPILRLVCPEASVVRVNLEFQENPLLAHAPQSLSLYPPAKAFFAYECPFGDCDGVYDLNELVWETLIHAARSGYLQRTPRRQPRGWWRLSAGIELPHQGACLRRACAVSKR